VTDNTNLRVIGRLAARCEKLMEKQMSEPRGEISEFEQELRALINRHCMENDSGTPDFILAEYLDTCLWAYNNAVKDRERWYGRSVDLRDHLNPGVTS